MLAYSGGGGFADPNHDAANTKTGFKWMFSKISIFC